MDPSDPHDITEYEDLTEEERERIDQRIFRQVLTDDPDKVEEERDEVGHLSRLADSLKHLAAPGSTDGLIRIHLHLLELHGLT